jgi:hypothetical protein
MPSRFEESYPNITRWVKTHGWIEIGQDNHSPSFAKALDEGGMVWEGGSGTGTLDQVFEALEQGIAGWMKDQGE